MLVIDSGSAATIGGRTEANSFANLSRSFFVMATGGGPPFDVLDDMICARLAWAISVLMVLCNPQEFVSNGLGGVALQRIPPKQAS